MGINTRGRGSCLFYLEHLADSRAMMCAVPTKRASPPPLPLQPFALKSFLDSAGVARTVHKYAKGTVIFAQGDAANDVMYIQHGSVKLSVLSRTGKEAVVAILGKGDFF